MLRTITAHARIRQACILRRCILSSLALQQPLHSLSSLCRTSHRYTSSLCLIHNRHFCSAAPAAAAERVSEQAPPPAADAQPTAAPAATTVAAAAAVAVPRIGVVVSVLRSAAPHRSSDPPAATSSSSSSSPSSLSSPSSSAASVNDDIEVLLVHRRNEPYAGYWGLPGGKVEGGESLQAAGEREVKEECGLTISIKSAPLATSEFIATSKGIQKDAAATAATATATTTAAAPTHWVLVHMCAEPLTTISGQEQVAIAGDDAAAVRWFRFTALADGKEKIIPDVHSLVQQAAVQWRATRAIGAAAEQPTIVASSSPFTSSISSASNRTTDTGADAAAGVAAPAAAPFDPRALRASWRGFARSDATQYGNTMHRHKRRKIMERLLHSLYVELHRGLPHPEAWLTTRHWQRIFASLHDYKLHTQAAMFFQLLLRQVREVHRADLPLAARAHSSPAFFKVDSSINVFGEFDSVFVSLAFASLPDVPPKRLLKGEGGEVVGRTDAVVSAIQALVSLPQAFEFDSEVWRIMLQRLLRLNKFDDALAMLDCVPRTHIRTIHVNLLLNAALYTNRVDQFDTLLKRMLELSVRQDAHTVAARLRAITMRIQQQLKAEDEEKSATTKASATKPSAAALCEDESSSSDATVAAVVAAEAVESPSPRLSLSPAVAALVASAEALWNEVKSAAASGTHTVATDATSCSDVVNISGAATTAAVATSAAATSTLPRGAKFFSPALTSSMMRVYILTQQPEKARDIYQQAVRLEEQHRSATSRSLSPPPMYVNPQTASTLLTVFAHSPNPLQYKDEALALRSGFEKAHKEAREQLHRLMVSSKRDLRLSERALRERRQQWRERLELDPHANRAFTIAYQTYNEAIGVRKPQSRMTYGGGGGRRGAVMPKRIVDQFMEMIEPNESDEASTTELTMPMTMARKERRKRSSRGTLTTANETTNVVATNDVTAATSVSVTDTTGSSISSKQDATSAAPSSPPSPPLSAATNVIASEGSETTTTETADTTPAPKKRGRKKATTTAAATAAADDTADSSSKQDATSTSTASPPATAADVAAPDRSETKTTETADATAAPKKRGRKKAAATAAAAADSTVASTAPVPATAATAENASTDVAAAEKPKRARRTKKTASAETTDDVAAPAAKPKRSRSSKKHVVDTAAATAATEAVTTTAVTPSSDAATAEATTKPARKSRAKKKAAQTDES